MKCPRCQRPLPSPVRLNAEGLLVCPACGSKLRPRTPAAAAPPPPPEPGSPSEDPLASLTEPEGPGEGNEGAPVAAPEPPSTPAPASGTSHPGGEASYAELLLELKAIRHAQERILDLVKAGGGPASQGSGAPATAGGGLRTQHRKTALLIDDDLAARTELAESLRGAEVPVREAGSGNEGLTLISQERPDVIVIEAELGGDMTSQDTITLIKATMEWIDIPIVLYTRRAIANQEEARTSYAADDFVAKGPGSAATMVARVIGLFRR